MNGKLIHVVRYLGNDGDQFLRNRAGYLTCEGDDVVSALQLPSLTAASELAYRFNQIFPGCFRAESLEV